MAVNPMNAGLSDSYKVYCKQQYAGVPDGTTTIEQKEKAIQAKKNIMKHPECSATSKAMLQKEIAVINGEIARAELENLTSAKESLNNKYNPVADSFAPQKEEKMSEYERKYGINGSYEGDRRPAFLKNLTGNFVPKA